MNKFQHKNRKNNEEIWPRTRREDKNKKKADPCAEEKKNIYISLDIAQL